MLWTLLFRKKKNTRNLKDSEYNKGESHKDIRMKNERAEMPQASSYRPPKWRANITGILRNHHSGLDTTF